MLRPDLDLDRPAGRRPAGAAPDDPRLAPHVRAGGLVSGSSPAVPRSSGPTCTSSSPTTRTPTASATTPSPSPSCYRSTPTAGAAADVATDVTALAQVHCHQHAVMKWDADRELLEQAGVDTERLDSGCCGLAGNFGFTAGHGEVSRALAEQTLLPRIRERRRRHRRPRRRLLLPHPDPRPRQRRPRRRAPRRAPGRTCCTTTTTATSRRGGTP